MGVLTFFISDQSVYHPAAASLASLSHLTLPSSHSFSLYLPMGGKKSCHDRRCQNPLPWKWSSKVCSVTSSLWLGPIFGKAFADTVISLSSGVKTPVWSCVWVRARARVWWCSDEMLWLPENESSQHPRVPRPDCVFPFVFFFQTSTPYLFYTKKLCSAWITTCWRAPPAPIVSCPIGQRRWWWPNRFLSSLKPHSKFLSKSSCLKAVIKAVNEWARWMNRLVSPIRFNGNTIWAGDGAWLGGSCSEGS